MGFISVAKGVTYLVLGEVSHAPSSYRVIPLVLAICKDSAKLLLMWTQLFYYHLVSFRALCSSVYQTLGSCVRPVTVC